jgi:hypothetical protein
MNPDAFERRVQAAMTKVQGSAARFIEGALVIVADLPGAEVVAEGVDPRIPVLLDDLSPEGVPPRAGRVFVYQRNVERLATEMVQMEEEIARALADEIAHAFPEFAAEQNGPESSSE